MLLAMPNSPVIVPSGFPATAQGAVVATMVKKAETSSIVWSTQMDVIWAADCRMAGSCGCDGCREGHGGSLHEHCYKHETGCHVSC